jgi:N-acetylgalactosamine kinase
MSVQCPEYTIILAGGKGSRMGSNTIPKVCFEIDGIPAVNRAIKTYNDCGIKQHILIVGALAGQVMETVGSKYGNVSFVYQREQLGTANALRCAFAAMPAVNDDAVILVAAGDRIIAQSVLERLFNLYFTEKCRLALLALPRRDGSGQGRIISDRQGRPLAIVEMADIRQRQVLRELRIMAENRTLHSDRHSLIKLIANGFCGSKPDEKKLAKAFGELWTLLHDNQFEPSSENILSMIPAEKTRFDFETADGLLSLTPAVAEQSGWCNNSVYAARWGDLKYALAGLKRDNAQQEEYLSDIVNILYRRSMANGMHETGMLKVEDHTQILGFNNPAELLEIENIIKSGQEKQVSGELPAKEFRPAGEWRRLIAEVTESKQARNAALYTELSEIYSDDPEVVKKQAQHYIPLIDFAAAELGEDAVVGIIRSPGRLNVMGRHVDHQGGNCNLMTIGYETRMVIHPRQDDNVCLHHLDANFKSVTFSISELVRDLPWDDWLSLINSEKLAKLISDYGVDWSHYVKAAVLRLQKKFTHMRLRGMDIFVSGNVPMAAGLSSSSTLVVGTAEAVVAVNRLDTFPSQLVTLCGEGEWFVGTRGGSADHAAVKLGQKGKVVKVTFFDFAVQDVVPFPEDYVMAVCDSGIKACKSSSAKDQFNHRICCYRIGFMLIKQQFPQYSLLLKHLRDLNTRTLGIPLSWIYRILLHLPEYATLDELQQLLPEENLRKLCTNHKPPADGLYPIRGVVLFGLSEFERSRLYAAALKSGNIAEIGRFMNVSHNGDRVTVFDKDWTPLPFKAPVSNAHILGLMEDLESGDPERVIRAQLQWQPGAYACSLPDIDRMVDIALQTPGVVGAQLAGAGLGGCMMVLARKDSVNNLIAALEEKYYAPAGAKTSVLVCNPVAGAGFIKGC